MHGFSAPVLAVIGFTLSGEDAVAVLTVCTAEDSPSPSPGAALFHIAPKWGSRGKTAQKEQSGKGVMRQRYCLPSW